MLRLSGGGSRKHIPRGRRQHARMEPARPGRQQRAVTRPPRRHLRRDDTQVLRDAWRSPRTVQRKILQAPGGGGEALLAGLGIAWGVEESASET